MRLTITRNRRLVSVKRRYVVLEDSFMLKYLATFLALMLLEVRSQMLPHRLVRLVFSFANCTFHSIVLSMVEQMKPQLVFCIEMATTVVASVV